MKIATRIPLPSFRDTGRVFRTISRETNGRAYVLDHAQFLRRIIAAIDFESSRFSRRERRARMHLAGCAERPQAPVHFAMVIIKTAPGMYLPDRGRRNRRGGEERRNEAWGGAARRWNK